MAIPKDTPEHLWELALQREPAFRKFLAHPKPRGTGEQILLEAAAEAELSRAQFRKLLKLYKERPQTQSLVLKPKGPRRGEKKLLSRVEEIIETDIRKIYLTLNKPPITTLVKGIRAKCGAERLPPPSKNAVLRRIALISERDKVKGRQGSKATREQFKIIKGSLETERPREIWQMDHTPADVHAVDSRTRLLLGRPFVTVAIDICTRMYCGFYLTFDSPSTRSVACCLVHSVMEKSAWLRLRNLEFPWPVSGLPETIHVDNAKEFHSKAFTRACQDYGIRIKYRPVARPHFGGHIESRIKNLSQELHRLPGTTFGNIKERGVYDSEGKACLTIEEIEYLITLFILEYNASNHGEHDLVPLAQWKKMTAQLPPRTPPDLTTFFRDFLPSVERDVRRDGISLFKIQYWHDALVSNLQNRKRVTVHYDPADMSKVFVHGSSGSYLEVGYRDVRHPAISLWELRAAKRLARAEGRSALEGHMLFEIINRQRKFIETKETEVRSARQSRARSALHPRPLLLPPPARSHAIPNDDDDDIPIDLPYYDTEARDD